MFASSRCNRFVRRFLALAAAAILAGTLAAAAAAQLQTYSFGASGASDAMIPQAGLIPDQPYGPAAFFGTTQWGGSQNSGAVIEITPSNPVNPERVIYNFCTIRPPFCQDGAGPVAGLIKGKDGKLYGTTYLDGLFGGGTVF